MSLSRRLRRPPGVYLPRVDETPESVVSDEIALNTVRGRKTVLIVEDDEAVRALASEFLESAAIPEEDTTKDFSALACLYVPIKFS